jgi:hypothetical protein
MLGHGLTIRTAQAKFIGDLQIGNVESHQIETRHPHPQWLVMSGQCSAGEVIKTNSACLAAIPLALRLRIVMTVPGYISVCPKTS